MDNKKTPLAPSGSLSKDITQISNLIKENNDFKRSVYKFHGERTPFSSVANSIIGTQGSQIRENKYDYFNNKIKMSTPLKSKSSSEVDHLEKRLNENENNIYPSVNSPCLSINSKTGNTMLEKNKKILYDG